MITDFGADLPFGRIPQKLREHHGIDVPISSAQAITQSHAAQVLQIELKQLEPAIPNESGVACLIVEMDGSMIPTVTTESNDVEGVAIDRRTTRKNRLARSPVRPLPNTGANRSHFWGHLWDGG